MRKLTSVLLIMIMVLCMGTTVFADDTPTTSITINSAAGDTASRTYDAYKLLNLTTSLKGGECANPHTSACYNYSYTVNADYLSILQNEVFNNKPEGTFESSTKVTQEDILDYLEDLTSDEGDTYGTLRPAADRIYSAIKEAGLAADKELTSGANTTVEVEQGYWLIADTTTLGTAYNANSLVMVNTKGQDTLTITPKTALPEFEKKVKDINNSDDSDIADNAWADSADHDMGDTVPFKLTATVPSNVSNYGTYTMIFHDTMGNGLTLDPTSVKVYKYNTKGNADDDKALVSGTLVFDAAVDTDYDNDDVKLIPAEGNHAFKLTMKNVLNGKDTAAGNNAFVVYYEATLNENAAVGSAGNSNTAYLEFSNNPYTDGTGKTPEDKVKVFTYQLTINKVDGDNNATLKGAGFILYKKDAADAYVAVGDELKGDDMTAFEWKGLDDGDYKLEEKTVPAGYNKMEDLYFTISAEHELDDEDPALTKLLGGDLVTGDFFNTGVITEDVENYTGTVLPSTGAKGTMMLIGGGSVLIVLAAVFMITRKKMSIYED